MQHKPFNDFSETENTQCASPSSPDIVIEAEDEFDTIIIDFAVYGVAKSEVLACEEYTVASDYECFASDTLAYLKTW